MTIGPANECGSCTLCCKLLGVASLGKPVNAWCARCEKGRGCRAYATRPGECAEFSCAWLLSVRAGEPVSRDLRPDRCKVVVHSRDDGRAAAYNAQVDPGYPDAWRAPGVLELLRHLAGLGSTVLVDNGRRKLLVDRDGIHEATHAGRGMDGSDVYARGRLVGMLLGG